MIAVVLAVLGVVIQVRHVQGAPVLDQLHSRLDQQIQKAQGKASAQAVRAVAEQSSRQDIRAEGWVVTYPGSDVIVGTDVQGTVVRLNAEEKQFVSRGQLVAELRADEDHAALDEARARVREADADRGLYDVEVRRAQTLFDEKVGTKQALDRAIRDRDAAIARGQTAAATVARLEATLRKKQIYAPISGMVMKRLVQPGETVKEGSQIIRLADIRHVRIEAEVDEFDSGKVRVGSPVIIKAEGFDGQQWRGRVEEIPDSVVGRELKPQDPAKPIDTRVLLVKVAILDKTPLKLGQKVEVAIAPAGLAPAKAERTSAGE